MIPPLPRLFAITDAAQGWPAAERAALEALDAGLGALVLRERRPGIDDATLEPHWRRLARAARARGALALVNRRQALARCIGADGLHLGADGPTLGEARARLDADGGGLLGYSAHGPDEALRAFDEGADYVFLSPIYPTPSKQGLLEPLGPGALAALAPRVPGPLIALGGVRADRVPELLAAGAHGLAAIRAVFGPPGRPCANTHALLDALGKKPAP